MAMLSTVFLFFIIDSFSRYDVRILYTQMRACVCVFGLFVLFVGSLG